MRKPVFSSFRPALSSASGSGSQRIRLIAAGIILAGVLLLVFGRTLRQSGFGILTRIGVIGQPEQDGGSLGLSDQSAPPVMTDPAILSTVSTDEILRLINEYRIGKGVGAIEKNDRFCELATVRAKEVASEWSQQTIVENKDYYFRAVCIKCQRMAELIARNISSPKQVVDEWLSSDDYRATLESGYNIGCAGGFTPDKVQAFIALELGEK
jgi:hypothetical protein